MFTNKKKQRGALLITAIVLITVIAMLAASAAYIISVKTTIVSDRSNRVSAFYLAESGLNRAGFLLNTGVVSCASITGDSNLTNITFGSGQFNVTAAIQAATPVPTLTSTITSSTTVIPVSSLTNLNSSGQVMIDKERINYANISALSADCGGIPPCLTGATRGGNGTAAASHIFGAPVSQRICKITATGAVPTLVGSNAQSTIGASIKALPQGWLVGEESSQAETIGIWEGSTWSLYSPSLFIADKALNGLAVLSYADIWAIGGPNNSNALLIHWDGVSWSQVYPNPAVNKELTDIDCVSSNDCWAVGDQRTFLHWDGTNWTQGNVKTSGSPVAEQIPNSLLNGVTCTSSASCWAVGGQQGSESLFTIWDGVQWKRSTADSSVSNSSLTSVSCPSNSTCWAVGKKAVLVGGPELNINLYQNGSWSRITNMPRNIPEDLHDVSCTSSNDCWAVGDAYAGTSLFLHWNGSTWSRIIPGSPTPTDNLHGVHCLSATNCWAVGENTTIAKWDGVTWVKVTPDSSMPNKFLYDVKIVVPNTNIKLESWQQK